MSVPVSIVIFLIIIWAIIKSKHNALVFLCILSLLADNFRITFGPSLLLIQVIGFLIIPVLIKSKILLSKSANRWLFFLYLEYFYLIISGVIFGFVDPWVDTTGLRSLSQQAEGRSLIALLRFLNDFIIVFYFAWVFYAKKISLHQLVYSVALASVISFWVGFFDYYTGYIFKETFFYVDEKQTSRFLGLNGEPKLLGRQGALAFAIIGLYYFAYKKTLFLRFSLLTNILAVILSLSASAIILFIIYCFVLATLIARLVPIIVISITLTFSIIIASQNPFFKEVTFKKIEKATLANEQIQWVTNEPSFFTRFDIFDRLALIYLWQNPKYLIFGTGPNLISIPASENIPSTTIFAEEGRIDSVPNVLFNNILARSGLIGLILTIIGFAIIYKKSLSDRSNLNRNLLLIGLLFSIVFLNPVIYMTIGIVIGRSLVDRKHEC